MATINSQNSIIECETIKGKIGNEETNNPFITK